MEEEHSLGQNGDKAKDTNPNVSTAVPLASTADQGLLAMTTNCGLSDTSTCSSSTEDSGIVMGSEGRIGSECHSSGRLLENGLSHLPPPPLSSCTTSENAVEHVAPHPKLLPLRPSPRPLGLTHLHTDTRSTSSCALTLYSSSTGNGNIFTCRAPYSNANLADSNTTSSRLCSYSTLSLLPSAPGANSVNGLQPWPHQEQLSGRPHHFPQSHSLGPLVSPASSTVTAVTVPVSAPPAPAEWRLKSVTKAQSSTLLYGMFSRTEDGTRWKCEECQRLFSSQGSLRAHARIHTGERPYQCQYCFRTFCQASTLRSHERLHTGEKPYKCEHCGRAFTQSAGLRSHLKTHRYDS